MDRNELSLAIIQEMGEMLESVGSELLTLDLATVEQRVQVIGRIVLGELVERVAAVREQLLPPPVRCATCRGPLRRWERPRHLSRVGGGLLRAARLLLMRSVWAGSGADR